MEENEGNNFKYVYIDSSIDITVFSAICRNRSQLRSVPSLLTTHVQIEDFLTQYFKILLKSAVRCNTRWWIETLPTNRAVHFLQIDAAGNYVLHCNEFPFVFVFVFLSSTFFVAYASADTIVNCRRLGSFTVPNTLLIQSLSLSPQNACHTHRLRIALKWFGKTKRSLRSSSNNNNSSNRNCLTTVIQRNLHRQEARVQQCRCRLRRVMTCPEVWSRGGGGAYMLSSMHHLIARAINLMAFALACDIWMRLQDFSKI